MICCQHNHSTHLSISILSVIHPYLLSSRKVDSVDLSIAGGVLGLIVSPSKLTVCLVADSTRLFFPFKKLKTH